MLNKKVKILIFTFFIFVISLCLINKNYAQYNENTDWKVELTSDTKEFSEIQQIKFKVQENENVVIGKIAPGLKGIASIDFNFISVYNDLELKVVIDDTNLFDCFDLKIELDGVEYKSGEILNISHSSSIERMNLILTWIGNDETDYIISSAIEEIEIPIYIEIMQKI